MWVCVGVSLLKADSLAGWLAIFMDLCGGLCCWAGLAGGVRYVCVITHRQTDRQTHTNITRTSAHTHA